MVTIFRNIDALNGVSVAYAVGLTNALLTLLFAFGFTISGDQRAAITGFVNAALVFTAHIAHAQAAKQTRTEVAAERSGEQ